MRIKARAALEQSSKVSWDLDRVPDGVEVHGRQRPPQLLPKPKLEHGQQLAIKRRSSLLGTVDDMAECGQSQSTRSLTSGGKSSVTDARQEPATRMNDIGPVHHLVNNDEPVPSAEHQQSRRRTSEPAGPADGGLVAHRCSEQQHRRGPSTLEEADSNSVTPPENSLRGISTSLAAHDRKLLPDIERFWNWTAVSLDDEQIQRIELFYSSHATQISVCRCLACLYFTSASTGMS